MLLEAECPRCPAPVTGRGEVRTCRVHGEVAPLWRAAEPCYESFAEHLVRSRELPTWLPWPLPLGWEVVDHGVVGGRDGAGDGAYGAPAEGPVAPRATFVTCGGVTDLDGPVEVTLLAEEPGVGLAARCARMEHPDPGRLTEEEPPLTRLDVEGATTPVWGVPTSGAGEALDRAVLVGEGRGLWLWLVLRPASVALSLQQLAPLLDVSALGPELVSLPFGAAPRSW